MSFNTSSDTDSVSGPKWSPNWWTGLQHQRCHQGVSHLVSFSNVMSHPVSGETISPGPRGDFLRRPRNFWATPRNFLGSWYNGLGWGMMSIRHEGLYTLIDIIGLWEEHQDFMKYVERWEEHEDSMKLIKWNQHRSTLFSFPDLIGL